MRVWQIAFFLSCAVHFSLFNLPYFSNEAPTEKIAGRTPIALRVIDRPTSPKKPSAKKIAQKSKEQPRTTSRKKIKKQKKLAKPSPLKPKKSKQKKVTAPSIEPVLSERPVPQLVSPEPKQPKTAPPIEVGPRDLEEPFAPKMAAVKPVGKKDVFKDLKILDRLVPSYPLAARREGREGTAQIKIQILENGDLGSVQLHRSSGSEDLDHAALKAVQSWRFAPARRNGIRVRQSAIFPIAFVLN